MAPHWVKAVLVSAPAIAVALVTWRHLTEAVTPYFGPIQKECEASLEAVENPLVKIFSFLNCLLVPFFTSALGPPEGVLIWINFASLGTVFGSHVNTETSRLGARFPLFLGVVYTAFFVLIGISIGVPLLWLPSYFLLGMPQSFPSNSSLKISWPRVWLIWAMNTLLFAAQLAPLFPLQALGYGEAAVKVLVWAPIALVPLLHLVPVFQTCDAQAGQQAVKLMHTFNAGIATTGHIVAILFCVSHPSAVPKLLGLLQQHEGADVCNYFLLVDLFVFWLSLLYHILVEDGIVPALLVVLGTPLLGLGAPLALYYLYRESLIFTHHKGVAEKDGARHKKKRKEA